MNVGKIQVEDIPDLLETFLVEAIGLEQYREL